MEIFDGARDDPLRAFGLGYLAHLAADSVAHNYFVPKQLAVTTSTSGFGHSYWESRFETHLGPECARRARELILIDHSRSDGLLDRVLSPTIFSTPTNRRIFRGMVIAADNESWQRIFQLMKERSRWDLADDDVSRYIARSYDFIMDLLMRMDGAEPFRLDPSGDEALRMAKRIRRQVLREGDEQRLLEEADRYFGMPSSALGVRVAASCMPLYAPEPLRQQLIHALRDRRCPSSASSRGRRGRPVAAARRRRSAALRRETRRKPRRSIAMSARVVADLEQTLTLGDRARPIARLHHRREDLLGRAVADDVVAHHAEQRGEIGGTDGEMRDRLSGRVHGGEDFAHHPVRRGLRDRRSVARPARSTRPSPATTVSTSMS